MTILKLSVSGTDLDGIVDYLIQRLIFDYENHGADLSILASENFYFRNMSSQANMIILKKESSCISIDIIGSGGGTGLLNIDFGSEMSYAKNVRKIVIEYSEEHGLAIEEPGRY